MNDDFKKWLEMDLVVRKRQILQKINDIDSTLLGLRTRIENDDYLNDLGELQQNGIMLDTAIAAYATQRQALQNYKRWSV